MKKVLCTTRLLVLLFFVCFLSVRSTAQYVLYSQGFENATCDTWGFTGFTVNSQNSRTGSGSGRVGRCGELPTGILNPVNTTGFAGLQLTIYHSVKATTSGNGEGMDTREGAVIQVQLNGGAWVTIGQACSNGTNGNTSWAYGVQGGGTNTCNNTFIMPNPLVYAIPSGTSSVSVRAIAVGFSNTGSSLSHCAAPSGADCNSFGAAMTSPNPTANDYDRTDEGFYLDDIQITSSSPTVVLTSAVGTDAQTVCQGSTITPITYSVAGPQGNVSGLPTGVSSSFVSGIVTITGTPTATPGTYTYQVTPCPNTSGTAAPPIQGTIVVKGSPTFTLTSATGTDNQTVCVNNPLTSITYTITGANATPAATITGLPPGTVGLPSGNLYIIGGTPSQPGVYNYVITATGDCGPKTQAGRITVNDKPSFTLTSASGTDNQTVCSGSAITNIVYTITGANGTPGITGLPTGLTSAYNSSTGVYTITGTPTAGGPFNYTITANGCGTQTKSGTITVNDKPVFTLTSASGTDNQTICINHPITNIVYTVTGASGTPTVTGLPTGVTGAYDNSTGIYTISGTPTASGPFNYTIAATSSCGPNQKAGTVNVSADPAFVLTSGTGSDNPSLCINTALTPITYTITGTGIATPVVSGLPTGVTGSYNSSTGVYTISGIPTVKGPFSYTITATGTCNNVPQSGKITVNDKPVFTLTSAANTDHQTVCINTAITPITYTITGAGITTTPTVTGLPTGVTGVYDNNMGIYTISGTPTASGPFNYTITATGSCGPNTQPGTINVNINPVIVLTSATGTDNQSICFTTAITPITYAVSGTGVSTPVVSGLPAGVTSGYNGGVFTISGSPTVSGPFSYTITVTGTCAPPAQANGNITINTAPVVAAITGPDAVCVGATIPLQDVTPGGMWSSLNAAYATVDNSGVVTGIASGTTDIQYKVSNTCGSQTVAHTVTVGDKPVVQPITVTASAICPDATFTASDVTTGGLWSSSDITIATINSNGIVTGIKGGSVTISYAVTNTCGTTTVPYTATIYPRPSITVSPAKSICHAGDVATLAASTDASSTVQWINTGNTNNPSVVNPPATTTYKAVATSDKGCTNTASTTVTVQDFKVSLDANPIPVVAGRQLSLTTSSSLPYTITSWQPAFLFPVQTANSQTIIADSTRTYTVTAQTAAGCTDTESITVLVTTPEYDLFVPNFFTPNGDGKNDILYVYGSFVQTMQLHIYDQWGNMVFESRDQAYGWDGTIKGNQAPVGVYVYVLRVLQKDNTVINKKGSINIIR